MFSSSRKKNIQYYFKFQKIFNLKKNNNNNNHSEFEDKIFFYVF
jgi:hypothetical protein